MFAFSDITAMYESISAVYKFTLSDTIYRQDEYTWRYYEWGANAESSDNSNGWVLSFIPLFGGCPALSVFDGTDYEYETLLNIHNPEGHDLIVLHILENAPAIMNNRVLLRLTEHPKTISHIDQVKLFIWLKDGRIFQIPLVSAIHSTLGRVKHLLIHSDDRRVDLLGASHNNGTSEYIDLVFLAPRHRNIVRYIFLIEGYNVLEKK